MKLLVFAFDMIMGFLLGYLTVRGILEKDKGLTICGVLSIVALALFLIIFYVEV